MGSDESHFNVLLINCEGQSHKTVSTDHNFWRERWAEADSNWGPSTYRPNRLTAWPNRLTACVYSPVCKYVGIATAGEAFLLGNESLSN